MIRFGPHPDVGNAVDMSDNEKLTGELEKMVEAMKGVVAMDIRVIWGCYCAVSLYFPNGATRKAGLQLSAIKMSPEQSRTRATGDSVWLDIERFAALFNHGTRRDFTFYLAGERRFGRESQFHASLRDLGLSIAQNANSVECLRIGAKRSNRGFLKQLFSLDVWKEAFPSLQRAYLNVDIFYNDAIDVSPHLMNHVCGVVQYKDQNLMIPPAYLDWIGSMIRNNAIEEINFVPNLLDDATLLDDTLRSVRSFDVEIECSTSLDHLARSFERTRAEGDKLERLSVSVSTYSSSAMALDTIIRSRPNLQMLHVTMDSRDYSRDFVALFQAVALSTLTTFTCDCGNMSYAAVEAEVALLCELPLHSTIRALELIVHFSPDTSDHDNDFVQGIAEGLRATRLRRFHLDVSSYGRVSIGSMTKLYESVRENRSLVDIQLKGDFWYLWRRPHYSLPAPPCPFSFFEFLSSRNQFLSQLLMPYEHTLPAGLWPLILESASCDASILYYLLTLQPYLVTGKVEGTADREWNVDGPARKSRRIV